MSWFSSTSNVLISQKHVVRRYAWPVRQSFDLPLYDNVGAIYYTYRSFIGENARRRNRICLGDGVLLFEMTIPSRLAHLTM
jgi:hypothetical protein